MLEEIYKKIENYYNNINLDIRIKGNNPRFMDQKCTPDVLMFIADCIVNLNQEVFTRLDIENLKYFKENVELIYGKPSPNNKKTKNEYDKFIGQQLELLSYAEILKEDRDTKPKIYTINNNAFFILEFIAMRDRNAFNFLFIYLEKFLKDSGFYSHVKYFIENQTPDSFDLLKTKFEMFLKTYSKIGTRGSKCNGKVEIDRIFPKVINVISCKNRALGVKKGRISKYPISFSEDLVYNKENFRDKNKLKNITRKEYSENRIQAKKYNKFLIKKAMDWVRKHHPKSEVNDKLYGNTDEVHHIFPKKQFKEISDYIENLIALTAGQHKSKAHPHSDGNRISLEYQCLCLLSKLNTIKNELENNRTSQYSKHKFIYVLSVGFKEKNLPISLSFNEIEDLIEEHYKNA